MAAEKFRRRVEGALIGAALAIPVGFKAGDVLRRQVDKWKTGHKKETDREFDRQ